MDDPRYIAFLVVWVTFTAVGIAVFRRPGDAARKRRRLPWFLAASGALFLVGVFTLLPFDPILLLLVPGIAMVVFLHARSMQFCPTCSRTSVQAPGAPRARFCPQCGASLAE